MTIQAIVLPPPDHVLELAELDALLAQGVEPRQLHGYAVHHHFGRLIAHVLRDGRLGLRYRTFCPGPYCSGPGKRAKEKVLYLIEGLHSGAWCYACNFLGEYLANLRDQSWYCPECMSELNDLRLRSLRGLIPSLLEQLQAVSALAQQVYQDSWYDPDAFAALFPLQKIRESLQDLNTRVLAAPPGGRLTRTLCKMSHADWFRVLDRIEGLQRGFAAEVARKIREYRQKPLREQVFGEDWYEQYLTTAMRREVEKVAATVGAAPMWEEEEAT